MEKASEQEDYDREITLADEEIEAGNFVDHADVEELFRKRKEEFTKQIRL